MTHPEAPSSLPALSARSLWPVAAGFLVAILGLAFGLRTGTEDRDILTNQHTLSISVHQLQQQVKDLSERLSAMNALQENRALVIEPARTSPPATGQPATDLNLIRRQLDEQARQLSVTRPGEPGEPAKPRQARR